MTKYFSGKIIVTLLITAICLMVAFSGAMAADETETSTAKVTFSEPVALFTLEGISPSGAADTLNMDFAGSVPMIPQTSFPYVGGGTITGDRWLKISDASPLPTWNVTASMSSFSTASAPETAVFDARITMSGLLSYRQIDATINDTGTGLSSSNEGWPAAALTAEQTIRILSSATESISVTANLEDANLNRGYFFIQFPKEGITLDSIHVSEAAEGENTPQIQVGTDYVATLTWTGVPTAVN